MDPYNLQRFVEAQDPVFSRVVDELKAASKRTHWMWFVFPQLAGLGSSAMAMRYAIASLPEAEAYLSHDVLGPRLRLCTALVNEADGPLRRILGQPDDMKFRSSVTLFSHATPDNGLFLAALEKHCRGEPDAATLDLLRRGTGGGPAGAR